MADFFRTIDPGYTREQYAFFLFALIAMLAAICLFGFLEWAAKRYKAHRSERERERLQRINHHTELRRRHKMYLAQMGQVLESVENRSA